MVTDLPGFLATPKPSFSGHTIDANLGILAISSRNVEQFIHIEHAIYLAMWGPQFCLLVSKPSIVMFVSQITNHREIGCIIYKPYNIVYEPTISICLYMLYHKTIIVKLE